MPNLDYKQIASLAAVLLGSSGLHVRDCADEDAAVANAIRAAIKISEAAWQAADEDWHSCPKP